MSGQTGADSGETRDQNETNPKETLMTSTIDLDMIRLAHGAHKPGSAEACVMEWVSVLAFTSSPNTRVEGRNTRPVPYVEAP